MYFVNGQNLFEFHDFLYLEILQTAVHVHPDIFYLFYFILFYLFIYLFIFSFSDNVTIIWAAPWQNQQKGICAQRRLRSA